MTFDDYTEKVLIVIITLCLIYFGAHILSYLVNG